MIAALAVTAGIGWMLGAHAAGLVLAPLLFVALVLRMATKAWIGWRLP